MTRPGLAAAALLLCLAAVPGSQAQSRLPPGVQGPAAGMATRSVSKYLGLERGLLEHIAQRDRAAVAALLAEDFEARTPASPDAIARDEWLQREFARPADDRIVHGLSVREVDDVAIVSFLLGSAKPHRKGQSAPTLFVVDVWRQSSGQLIERYVDRPVAAPPAPSRPTGRE